MPATLAGQLLRGGQRASSPPPSASAKMVRSVSPIAEHALARAVGRVAVRLELDGDVDDAAGVGDEVGRPEDAAGVQVAPRGRRRRAGCSRRRRPRGSAARAPCRGRARRRARTGRRCRRRRAAPRPARPRSAPSSSASARRPARRRTTTSRRAGGGEAPGERAADVAEADHRDAAPGEVRRAPQALGGDADRRSRRRAPSTGSGRPSRRARARARRRARSARRSPSCRRRTCPTSSAVT